MVSSEKVGYFKKRFKSVWEAYLEFDEKITKLLNDTDRVMLDPVNNQVQEQCCEYCKTINIDYRNVLYGSMLLMVCSLAEYIFKELAKEIVPNYENRIGKRRGNWLIRNLDLIKEGGKVNIDENDVEFLSYYIRIRNCITHNGGIVSSGNAELETAIAKIQEYAKKGNYLLLKVTSDGHLILGDNLVGEVYIKIVDILDGILDFAGD
ncbi:MAG: hypothetical protein WC962_01070 [Phycisphaerae bacterium]